MMPTKDLIQYRAVRVSAKCYLSLLVVVLCDSALRRGRGADFLTLKLFLHTGKPTWQRACFRVFHDLHTNKHPYIHGYH